MYGRGFLWISLQFSELLNLVPRLPKTNSCLWRGRCRASSRSRAMSKARVTVWCHTLPKRYQPASASSTSTARSSGSSNPWRIRAIAGSVYLWNKDRSHSTSSGLPSARSDGSKGGEYWGRSSIRDDMAQIWLWSSCNSSVRFSFSRSSANSHPQKKESKS